jgi:putative oxidoreductase
MSTVSVTPQAARPLPVGLAAQAICILEMIPYWVLGLSARVFPAAVFWQSGQTKVEGWHLEASAIELFREEYRLPVVDPVIAAHAAAFAEHFFPSSSLVSPAGLRPSRF